MKLISVHIIKAATCGGLLDGLDLQLRSGRMDAASFEPLCLIGPNGAGKSQFLQVLAEIFQSALHAIVPSEERLDGNADLEFEVEYLIRPHGSKVDARVRLSRKSEGKKKTGLLIQRLQKGEWKPCGIREKHTRSLLPSKIVGYTSGGNETLSLPFLLSRSGYADELTRQALSQGPDCGALPDTRLMLIDYGTHLEVLVANLLFSTKAQNAELLGEARLKGINSFRCVVQLAHSAAPSAPARSESKRKGIQLTQELEAIIDQLQRCSTCWNYDPKDECYTFDFLVDGQTKKAFGSFWKASIDLYSSLHKLAMLNDLAIPKKTRTRFNSDTKARRFASRLPEPQDEDKVFRFERVNFDATGSGKIVDYVSLSDGEHQLAQLLGTFAMISFPGVLFLLDEPESHFNPKWRVKFISRLMDLPTSKGSRRDSSGAALQDGLMTTHAPFVPSDMARSRVLIFGKDDKLGKIEVRHPDIETLGTTFDAILDECFDVRPPISQESRDLIDRASRSQSPKNISDTMSRLGYSVEKVFLADHLRQLKAKKSKNVKKAVKANKSKSAKKATKAKK
jgi:restriction system-associated AAA family ATPase